VNKYVVDIEANALYAAVTHIWIVQIYNLSTKEESTFLEGDAGWQILLDDADMIAGHNIIGYDLMVLKKITGWVPKKKTQIIDTMLLSQCLNYRRFGTKGHSLHQWGLFLGDAKGEWTDFSQYTPAMLEYCIQDVRLTVKVYNYLIAELQAVASRSPQIKLAVKNEHAVAKFCARAEERGWLFDKEAGVKLLAAMEEEMKRTEEIIEPMLLLRIKAHDSTNGEYPFVEPKWTKAGAYYHHIAKWFDIDPLTGQDEDRLIDGPFSRIDIIYPDMSNMEDVKRFLFSIGWDPDDWNWGKDAQGNKYKTSPKLSEESLLALGKYGEIINDYTTTKSRAGILRTWLESLDAESRLHGSCFTFATPTGRARHNLLVNTPGADKPWGKEIRSLFRATPGKRIIGADSSGNQFRALCHYLQNDEYTNLVLTGDVHQKNADVLTAILREMKVLKADQEVLRKTAKPFIYAFLFGAGGEKLALIVLGKRDKKIGNKLKSEFIKRVPGLEPLVEKLTKIYYKTEQQGDAYVPGIDGSRIYCDSGHKALNYLLQRFEAISCKAAVAYMAEKMEKENIPYEPLIWYHDEFEIETDEEYAQRGLDISIEAYRESGKPFGMLILDGAGKIGDSWYDVH
jgi:DNA polymerase I-like protein with 3'-5' exonuclease and polymerase domains